MEIDMRRGNMKDVVVRKKMGLLVLHDEEDEGWLLRECEALQCLCVKGVKMKMDSRE